MGSGAGPMYVAKCCLTDVCTGVGLVELKVQGVFRVMISFVAAQEPFYGT